jgi:glutamate decarboxylase
MEEKMENNIEQPSTTMTTTIKTKNNRKTRKNKNNECPPFATLPSTTLYLRRASKYLKTQKHKKEIKQRIYKLPRGFPKTSMTGNDAFQLVRHKLIGDHDPDRNLITFVNVIAEDKYHDKIMFDTRNINFIDTKVYASTKQIEQDIVHMMGKLYHDKGDTYGISTIGSSEAIYVSVVLNKFKWEERHNQEAHTNLNMIYSFNTHVNWDKASRWNYIQQQKILPKENDPTSYVFGRKEVEPLLNKDTIMIACTLGTTRTGQNDNIKEINDLLKEYHKKTGVFIPIHVDAAIGGFIVPFMRPELLWDFKLEHVVSMNISVHKYGGSFPGMGLLLVKSSYTLPEKFRFTFNVEKTASSNKLGADPHSNMCHKINCNDETHHHDHKDKYPGELDDWYINFSKPASQIISAYYLIQKLGFKGYKHRIQKCLDIAKLVSDYMNSIQWEGKRVFRQINQPYYPEIAFKQDVMEFPLKPLLTYMEKVHGFSVAAYELDPSVSDTVVRFVVKPNFSRSEALLFIKELDRAIENKLYKKFE